MIVAAPELTVGQLHDLLRLRVDVFVVEQNCPYHEIDGRDLEPTTVHLWTCDDGGITSSLRLLADPAGTRIGRVVTRHDRRGQRLAAQLMTMALDHIGHDNAVLDAQAHLEGFYAGFGFEVSGPLFVEDGIDHVPMLRTVTEAAS